jgi:hypothetical protein
MTGTENPSGREEKKERYVIYQFPNWQLWLMMGSWILARLSSGAVYWLATTIFYIATIIWAYANGVNVFRRILGTVVLVIIGFGIFYSVYQT